MYGEEIGALRQHSRALETLYQQDMGKVHARTYGPRLRDMGLSGVWFAILEGLTIASGRTRQEVEQAVQRIVPQHYAAIRLHVCGARPGASSGLKGVPAPPEVVLVSRETCLVNALEM